MSDRIRDSLARGQKLADGGAFPFSRLSAMTIIGSLLFAVLTLALLPANAVASKKVPPQGEDAVTAFLVKETGSSAFLKAKNVDQRISPASLTKIMTCMIAIESGRLDEAVTIPLEATQVEPTKAGFKTGDRFRLRDLVEAAMVNSSNDAAFAIAIHLGGSVKGFVSKMNSRARQLGMTSTLFTNPAGYDRGAWAGNRSTARDLMKLTEHAIKYSEFNAMAKLDKVSFCELNNGKRYYLSTHNKLLDRYPYSVGIKTGYTSKAGPCLIARALRDGKDMLVIMLHAKTDRWELASSMFDQGFNPLASSGKQVHVAAVSAEKNKAEPVSPDKKRVAALTPSARKRAAVVPVGKPAVSDVSSVKASVDARPEPVPAKIVYARRAKALEALRLKVERQAEEREAARREEASKAADEQAGNQKQRKADGQEVSLSRQSA